MSSPAGRELPRAAKVYLAAVGVAAAALVLLTLPRLGGGGEGWIAFAVLATAAAVSQLFPVYYRPRRQDAPDLGNHSYQTSIVFMLSAVCLVPAPLLGPLALVQHVPEWLKNRYPWYIQTFNICNHTLNVFAAAGAARLVHDSWPGAKVGLPAALAGLAACAVYVVLNHALLATMLRLARGRSLRETGLFTVDNISLELSLATLGIVIASLWTWNAWLIPAAVAPLFVLHRSLSMPQLREAARVDPKTGLFNARHCASALESELRRARRFERPLALILADLDQFRQVNNEFGHLAGDAVLRGVADVVKAHLRPSDIPVRFGGEELAILLPETPAAQAFEVAERLRRAVAETSFEIRTVPEPLRITISLGVAGFPGDGANPDELVHQADSAVYRAKRQGRNRTCRAGGEAELLPGERSARLSAV